MDKSKAKKAVKKSESRKKSAGAEALTAQQLAMAMQGSAIDPEIQAAQIAMQPADGFVNPYRAMGTVAAMQYSPGNILDGYNSPLMVNPET
jgi:ElaB/YqjD/DUF883 family membrane-anchored ribosome-binding protein